MGNSDMKLESSHGPIVVFSSDQLISMLKDKDTYKGSVYSPGTISDVSTAAKMVKELGLFGRVILKSYGGKQYVILKGYPGLREVLRGTRYLGKNPKMVSIGIGREAVKSSLRSGTVLNIVVYTGINVVDYLINDKTTLTQLIGTTATDIVKVGVAASVAAVAAEAVAGTAIASFALGPLAVVIAVGVLVSLVLDEVDRRYGLTERLIALLDEMSESTQQKIMRAIDRLEREIIWQACPSCYYQIYR